MAQPTIVRNGLAARLSTIDGLTGYARARGNLIHPAALVLPGPIEFDETMGNASHTLFYEVLLLVTAGTVELEQVQLDPYLASEGDKSVKAALEDSDAVPIDDVDFVHVARVSDYGDIEYSGKVYLGARFAVEVNADGS